MWYLKRFNFYPNFLHFSQGFRARVRKIDQNCSQTKKTTFIGQNLKQKLETNYFLLILTKNSGKKLLFFGFFCERFPHSTPHKKNIVNPLAMISLVVS